jgi:hypothetical protein
LLPARPLSLACLAGAITMDKIFRAQRGVSPADCR